MNIQQNLEKDKDVVFRVLDDEAVIRVDPYSIRFAVHDVRQDNIISPRRRNSRIVRVNQRAERHVGTESFA